MNNPAPETQKLPVLPLETVLTAICNACRWRILAILADGQGYGAPDIAGMLGITYPGAYQHLLILRNAGIIVQGRGRLYRIAPAYQPDPAKRILDLGHCLLRLDHSA